MIGRSDIDRLRGADVVDTDGHAVGRVGETFLGDDGQPHWVTVRTGLFGRRESFVPLEEAQLDGDVLRIPYSKAQVKDAPHFDPESALTEEEEVDLHHYYDRSPGASRLTRHDSGGEERRGDVEELPEERPRVATSEPPRERGHFEAEGTLLHPDEDDQIRRNQVDFDGETGRDRV
ncbi:PRC-barrel domain-containing protein [Naasia sp. SYSU D00057]|uniref:PRC-barrel domain-containing protein n=1 Tax=Naasia sp. SYSU D00057 TaxID=2817380 RepID=UPI001B31649D|nr:PRC-barrel domain-containing protein [Naasia sp. SYSU D00057]